MKIPNLKNIIDSKPYKYSYGFTLSIVFYCTSYLIYLSNIAGGRYFLIISFTIGSINLVYTVFYFIKYSTKNDSMDSFYKSNNFKKYQKKHKIIFIAQFIFLLVVLLIPLFYVGGTYVLTDAENELENVVNNLVDNSMNETQKVDALLTWFDRRGDETTLNYSNMYYRKKDNDILLKFFGIFYIYDEEPHFCFRFLDEPEWIISSKCGMCGEIATLFREMGFIAGLNVSTVYCIPEDHVWNEVYIDGIEEPLIIDATSVNSNYNNSNGYKPSDFMENKVAGDCRREGENPDKGNVSFVYGQFKGESINHNVTERYTDVINLTINVANLDGNPLQNCSVKIKSYNRPGVEGYSSWGLKKTTDEMGQCTFTLGGGKYKFNLHHKDDLFSFESELEKFWEDEDHQYYNVTYKSKSIVDVLFENPEYILIIVLTCLFVVVSFIEKKKKPRNKS